MPLEIPQNSNENPCARVSFLIYVQVLGLQLYKKETLTQVFFCEFCEISKNAFLYRTFPVAASVSPILLNPVLTLLIITGL